MVNTKLSPRHHLRSLASALHIATAAQDGCLIWRRKRTRKLYRDRSTLQVISVTEMGAAGGLVDFFLDRSLRAKRWVAEAALSEIPDDANVKTRRGVTLPPRRSSCHCLRRG